MLLAVLVTAGCGSPQNTLSPHSKAARSIASLWWNMLIGSALAFGIVVLILAGAWVRRNRPGFPGVRDGDRAALGVVLTFGLAIPIVVLSTLFLVSNIFLIRDTSLPTASAAPGDRPKLTIRVIGHQFWWEVRYPGTPAVTANEIHIPARTPVQVLVYTDDVIHSFWVPELNRKIDMIPDQTNSVLLYADKVGRYRGQCAEFCGLQHAHMGFYVFADPPARFRAWLARESQPATQATQVFQVRCSSCHAIRGTPATSNVGPDLTHLASRTSLAGLTIPNTPERLREWIRDPQQFKPGNQMPALGLTSAEIAQLVAYLEKLR
ncbi:MAG: c-type cytochrome [Actinomycetia bacterium]|nr:c-type cytochrome [Actinomycetes bacterium]